MDDSNNTTDLTDCDREPIRIPGSIQPHGYLMCLDRADLRILQYSANLPRLFQVPAEDLVRLPLARHVGEALVQDLAHALQTGIVTETPYLVGNYLVGQVEAVGPRFNALVHQHDGRLILELEASDNADPRRFPMIYPMMRVFVSRLQDADSVKELCQLAAEEMRRITGFGRTMVYRFDAAGHGEVLGEDRDEAYTSHLGQWFPAGDIPRQARELYLLNRIRVIPSASYEPVPLLSPANGVADDRPIDLSHAVLRSVSPVHLEYMRNMGTLASMSVSIVVRGELWGLISCHDAQPRNVGFEVRTACEHLGQILSLQVEAKQERQAIRHRLELRSILVSLLAALSDDKGSLGGLLDSGVDLLRFANADGAAIVHNDECRTIGRVPDTEKLQLLATWLLNHGKSVFSCDSLVDVYPAAEAFADVACGVLSVSISQVHRHLVIWFRQEVAQTIDWAGDPRKGVVVAASTGRLHPRQSFDTWRQIVRGRSLPWQPGELDAAEQLRHALLAIVLRRAEEMAELAGELGRINKELEAFSYSVSHDLRAPLRHISGYADMLIDNEHEALSERGKRHLAHVKDAARFAGELVDALLSFSKMGRTALRKVPVDLNEVVRDFVKEISFDHPERSIQWDIGPLPVVQADVVFVHIAMRNLIGNAVKYTQGKDPAYVSVTCEESPDEYLIKVADNGVGFNMKYVNKLFGVFQRLHAAEQFEGTGIGLANVRRVIERHGGTVSAHGEPGRGATFSFTLPKERPEATSH
ncbi:ATP-binding protein [Aquabacterium sp.]|uniref:ATP-binding protein n=1 Tax=Aquabacterium sp. TaxID=1872578 RepID=UPI003D6D06CD